MLQKARWVFFSLGVLPTIFNFNSHSEFNFAEVELSYSSESLPHILNPITQTHFDEKIVEEIKEIPYPSFYEDDLEKEFGQEEVKQEGENGRLVSEYQVTLWQGQEVNRELINQQKTEPVPKIILQGKKITWRTLETAEGEIEYWRKLHVFATSYDGNCSGCRGLTASGTPVKHGVCAVDPNVIPLGTLFYIPGYGQCRAEDKGGAIRGNRIDLGFEDVENGWWSACWTDVYLLSR